MLHPIEVKLLSSRSDDPTPASVLINVEGRQGNLPLSCWLLLRLLVSTSTAVKTGLIRGTIQILGQICPKLYIRNSNVVVESRVCAVVLGMFPAVRRHFQI